MTVFGLLRKVVVFFFLSRTAAWCEEYILPENNLCSNEYFTVDPTKGTFWLTKKSEKKVRLEKVQDGVAIYTPISSGKKLRRIKFDENNQVAEFIVGYGESPDPLDTKYSTGYTSDGQCFMLRQSSVQGYTQVDIDFCHQASKILEKRKFRKHI